MPALSNTHLVLVSLIFFGFIVSILVNYVLLRFAKTLGMRHKKVTEVRWDPKYKPSLGGISFYILFLFSFVFYIIFNSEFQAHRLQITGFLIAVSIAFFMGLADDAFNTQPMLKLISQIICALILLYSGFSINVFENVLLDYLITVIWIVGMMNSFNLLDNMDGITGSISIAIAFFFVIVSVTLSSGNTFFTYTVSCLIGTLFGFLFYNFHPSKLYMGDSGSQFLGLFLAAYGIIFCWNTPIINNDFDPKLINPILVFVVFLLPITDTTTVFINRIKRGSSPFVGGKDHTTHYLFFNGVTEKRIAILYAIITFISSLLAYKLIFHSNLFLIVLAILYIIIVFSALYYITIRKRPDASQKNI